MTRSMTGYASRDGSGSGWAWTWEMRGVNGRGLDIRMRLPEQIDGIEGPLRSAVQKVVKRGNVSVSLRISKEETSAVGDLNEVALGAALDLIARVGASAKDKGVSLRETGATEILSMRGVLETRSVGNDADALRTALLDDIPKLVDAYDKMRLGEGAALSRVILAQIDEIDAQIQSSRALVDERAAHMRATYQTAMERVLETAGTIDQDRVAQELAQIAVKADVAEELDRLDAHVDAARDLMTGEEAKGRKLDFLVQEFNREANTLCSKAQFAELTRVGLDLKHTIDQMREQVQNVE